MDCMNTLMESNLKLLSNASLEMVDAMMYGEMIYLTNTRLDIFFAVNTLRQFLTDLRHVHLISPNHILRYLKGTVDYGLKYYSNQKINLEGYVDLDWEMPLIGRALQSVDLVWDQV